MTSSQVLFLFLILFIFSDKSTSVISSCPTSCTRAEPVVRFPFRLTGQFDHCGYPGFELSCNNMNQTTLQLPNSGEFTVHGIDYMSQIIIINDPDQCIPGRLLHRSFSLSGSPFDDQNPLEFMFLNCSSEQIPNVNGLRYVDCLSGANFTVVAIPMFWYNESTEIIKSSCSEISTVLIPVRWLVWSNLGEGVALKWKVPDCTYCEERGRFCGFKNAKKMDLKIGCADAPGSIGLPRSVTYGIVIVISIGIPGLLCFIGLGCYLCGKVSNYRQRHHSTTDFAASITPQAAVVVNGLDRPTIESYPKTLVDESGRLPKPNDNTCPICLCEYQPRETLRTIPECSHYFHANCIDQWLKVNATCPLCRKSRDDSAFVTPASTSLSSSSSSSSFKSIP